MNRLRLSLAMMFAWLLLFYNIERFHEPINIASFVYVYVACIAIAMVAIPHFRLASATVVLPLLFAAFLGLKWLRGYEVLGASLPLTVTEATAIGITFFMAWTIAHGIRQFEDSAADVFSMHPQGSVPDFTDSQVEFYREVRRAREFERPLLLLTLKSLGVSTSVEINRFLQEMQRNTVKRYIDAHIGRVVASHTKDCDMIAYTDDHFVMLLPEVDGERAPQVIEELTRAVSKATGMRLQIGHAAFPAQEVTLTGLLSRAVSEMQAQPPATPVAVTHAVVGTKAPHESPISTAGGT